MLTGWFIANQRNSSGANGGITSGWRGLSLLLASSANDKTGVRQREKPGRSGVPFGINWRTPQKRSAPNVEPSQFFMLV